MNSVMAKMCHTSSRSVRISASIRMPMIPMTNSHRHEQQVTGKSVGDGPGEQCQEVQCHPRRCD